MSTAFLSVLWVQVRRGKLLTLSVYFLLVSSTIFFQTYNRKSKNEEKQKQTTFAISRQFVIIF